MYHCAGQGRFESRAVAVLPFLGNNKQATCDWQHST